MTSHWQTRKQLNLASDSPSYSTTLAARIGQFWQFMTQGATAPAVEIQQVTEQGRPWWYAYEAATGDMTYLESEQDIEMWLEEQLRQ
jgi:hypothetical protein